MQILIPEFFLRLQQHLLNSRWGPNSALGVGTHPTPRHMHILDFYPPPQKNLGSPPPSRALKSTLCHVWWYTLYCDDTTTLWWSRLDGIVPQRAFMQSSRNEEEQD